jgi:enamine deaminase RidA (YjgF/YER057c/UK114 family)
MITRLGSTELLHCAVRHDNVVYLSGVTADERNAGMAGQTLQVLEKIAKWLTHFGSDRAHMLSASIYLSDMSMKDEMNAVWKKWFGGQDMPARP